MKNNNKENLIKSWIKSANEDFLDAEILFKGKSYKSAAWHLHQSIEKLLKAILLKNGKQIRKIHDLISLFEDVKLKLPQELKDLLEELNFHYLPPRYPDILPQLSKIYTRVNINQLIRKTKSLIKWLKNQTSI